MYGVANKFAILVVVVIALSLAIVVVIVVVMLAFVRIPSLFTQNIAYMPSMQAQCYTHHIVYTKSL